MSQVFTAIDLKSFYASVECNERGRDPLTTHLVVADASRTDKTICLAISPSLKAYGLPGRARLFEVNQKVKEINYQRRQNSPLGILLGKSTDATELAQNPNLALDFIIATPRMQYYLDYSSKIYNTYLRHVAPEDIFAYSIDEVFCELTSYLKYTKTTPAEFVTKMISDVYQNTSITATAGIGTNLFLAKVAMDILAKHTAPNSAGVRIAELDEQSFRTQLWAHAPITDFWRIGRGYAKRLAGRGIYTMGDVARCSLENPRLLYQLFGVNAELLIDHAWGYECVNITDAKHHQPSTKSLSSGQVLSCPYNTDKARIIVREMAESLSLDLVRKNYLTNHLVLTIDYAPQKHTPSPENHTSGTTNHTPDPKTVTDHYGRRVPKPLQGTIRLKYQTNSTKLITDGFLKFYDQHVSPNFTIRKVSVCANDLIDANLCEDVIAENPTSAPLQTDFFTNYAALEQQKSQELTNLRRENSVQKAILKIRDRYGKNAILRGTNFEDGATARSRHHQIGGHRA